MFPTGLTEVMLTPPPLEPPRPGLDLAPDLVLGLALCDVFRLLDLPTLAPFSTCHVRWPRKRLQPRKGLAPDAEPHASENSHAAPLRYLRGVLAFLGFVSITPGQRVRHSTQEAFFLDLLLVPLPLCLPGVFLCLVGSLRLGRLFLGFRLPLLRPAFLLLGLVACQGAPGLFGLACGFVVHAYSFPLSSRLTRLLFRSADHVLNRDATLRPGALHLGEVHAELLGLLLGGVRGFRLLLLTAGRLLRGLLALLGGLASRLLRLSGRLTRSVLHALGDLPDLVGDPAERSALLLTTAQAAGEAAHGVLSLAHRLSGLVGHLSRRV